MLQVYQQSPGNALILYFLSSQESMACLCREPAFQTFSFILITMRLKGNIQDIKTSRDTKNKDIEVYIDVIEYITHKKDGRFYQPFDFEDKLETPLVITGDCLARTDNKHLEEGEYEFLVYDNDGEDYVLNENKELTIETAYDFDENLTIVTSVYYTVTVSNEEFKQLKTEKSKAAKAARKGKGRR